MIDHQQKSVRVILFKCVDMISKESKHDQTPLTVHSHPGGQRGREEVSQIARMAKSEWIGLKICL